MTEHDDSNAFAGFYALYAIECIRAGVAPLRPDALRAVLEALIAV